MKNKREFILALLLVLMVPGQGWAKDHAAGTLTPPSGKTILFVGQDRETIARYVKAVGTIPAGVMLYTSVQDVKGLDEAVDYGSGFQDGNGLLHAYPQAAIQIGLYMVGVLEGVIAGTYDQNIAFLAGWIKKADRPVYLRIGYEFDNPDNHYDPDQYKQAFRHIVDVLRKQGVQRTVYVWHSYSVPDPKHPWMDWYPGDEYVDWFGASVFSTGQLWAVQDFLNLARQHQKPFMLAESTPAGSYTIRGRIEWFNHMFRFINDRNIEAFCYINSNWDAMPMFKSLKWGDARIEAEDDIKELWMKEIARERYL